MSFISGYEITNFDLISVKFFEFTKKTSILVESVPKFWPIIYNLDILNGLAIVPSEGELT